MAYGASALAIGEALVEVGAPRPLHVIIDPLQATAWSDVGWQLLQSAGLGPVARLIQQPSSLALPQLIAEELVADAAFVDGSHRFHEVFVDLYFLRKIVRPGAFVVVDDHWWPSVRPPDHIAASRARALATGARRPRSTTTARCLGAASRAVATASRRVRPAAGVVGSLRHRRDQPLPL